MSFVAYSKDVEARFNISQKILARNFYSCLWIFGLELALIALILKTVVFDVHPFKITTPGIEIFICRFVTSMLLHMELIE
jgi:hypothetical protein